MNTHALRLARRRVIGIAAAVLLLVSTLSAHAQFTSTPYLSLGGISNLGPATQGMDSAYDPVNNVHLVVSAYFNAWGWFIRSDGTLATGPFLIRAGGGGAFAPRVEYSPNINNGQGGFMMIYGEEVNNSRSNVLYARTIAYGAGGVPVIGGEVIVSDTTSYPSIIAGSSAIAYSSTSQVFLVAWMTAGVGVPHLMGRTIGLSGQPMSGVIILSSYQGIYPGIAWNSSTDRFGVSFVDEGSRSGLAAFVLVTPSGGIQARRQFNEVVGQQGATDIDFNPDTGRFVMAYFQQPSRSAWDLRAAELDSGGNIVTSGLMYSKLAGIGFSSLSLAFNPVSRTFLGASSESIDVLRGPDPIIGFELNRRGYRTSGMVSLMAELPTLFARNIRVSANTESASWHVAFNHNTQTALSRVVITSSVGGGPAGEYGAGGGSAPPPSSPPPPTSSCTSTRPASDWVCVNGNWLPPGMAGVPAPPPPPSAPAPPPPPSSSCPTVRPASDWVCVNGNWLPPGMGGVPAPPPAPPSTPAPAPTSNCFSVRPASDWVCYNGDWLPPGLVPAASPPSAPAPPPSSSVSCTTVKPAPDWLCVNGNWLPAAMVCPTVQPGPGWTCRSGDWLPPGMGSNLQMDPAGVLLPAVLPRRTTVVAGRVDVARRTPVRRT